MQVFENKGAMMGCSNPHPHCQIWATEHLPTSAQRRLGAQRRYLQENGRDLLGDYLSRERVEGERIVCANDHWAVLVPFWAAWPFETLVVPARTVGHLSGLFGDERDALADILGRLNRRYDNLFGVSFPYSMSWHGQPSDGQAHPYWRLHASYFPPLLRSATIRKFVVGYELAAEAQRDFTPEDAAARLRAVAETPRPKLAHRGAARKTGLIGAAAAPPRPRLAARRPAHGDPAPGHDPHAVRGDARRPPHRARGQQLPQLEHAGADGDGRELLRDHGRRRHLRDHLGRDRPVRRLRLRAGRSDDGPVPARARLRPRTSRWWPSVSASAWPWGSSAGS